MSSRLLSPAAILIVLFAPDACLAVKCYNGCEGTTTTYYPDGEKTTATLCSNLTGNTCKAPFCHYEEVAAIKRLDDDGRSETGRGLSYGCSTLSQCRQRLGANWSGTDDACYTWGYFKDGGSYVGRGCCCSSGDLCNAKLAGRNGAAGGDSTSWMRVLIALPAAVLVARASDYST